jgi:O-antigen/teichoic acid export membrane protein
MSIRYIVNAFFWSTCSKIITAVIGIISVPLLITLFGVSTYGVLALAMASNACLMLLDMGIATGSIKFYSQWLERGEILKVDSVARTSISFYAIIGIVNAFVLVIVALEAGRIFNLNSAELFLIKKLLFVLAGFSVLNWVQAVFRQLLIANNMISFIEQLQVGIQIVKLSIVILTVYLKMPVEVYFFLFL